MKARHLLWKESYTDRHHTRDFPFKNIENARPETVAASEPRITAGDLPFDPTEVLQHFPKWEDTGKVGLK